MIWRLLCSIVLALALAGSVYAQEAPDYKSWTRAAERAQDLLADKAATEPRLSELRASMVKWRASFSEAQGANGDAIATLRGQIEALGPAPAEGASEDPTIAKRRATLTEDLAKLQAPLISAGEAATLADGIIRSIDKQLRERQADKLLRLSPSPLNPVNWPAAVSMLRWMTAWIYDETVWRFTQPVNWQGVQNNAPLIAVLVLAAGLIFARGHRWLGLGVAWGLARTPPLARGLVSGLASVLEAALPVLASFALVRALITTGFFGPVLVRLLEMVPELILVMMAARWIGKRVFALQGAAGGLANLSEEARAEGRFHALSMGVAVALQLMLANWIAPRAQDFLGGAGDLSAERIAEAALRADAAVAVLAAPLQVFAALMLLRMGQLLRRPLAQLPPALSDVEGADRGAEFFLSVLYWLGTACIVVAVLAPALGLIGYIPAADALIWPAIMTLAVLGLVNILQGVVTEVYATLTRSDAHEGLIPVLAGFLLALGAFPVLALIWGARPEDLAEIWTKFVSGVAVGGVRISPTVFLTFTLVFGIGYWATRVLQSALKTSLLPKTRLDLGGQNAIVSGTGYVGIFLAAVFAISSAGIDLSSLAIVAGALSVGIGFGLQNIVSNFVSGIILLIERPISEGDTIQVGTQQGVVRSISVRSTRIETADRAEVIVPNADLVAAQVTNLTRGNKNGRVLLPLTVGYESDTRQVERILLDVAQAHALVQMTPEPQALFIGFGADGYLFELRAVIADVGFKGKVTSDLNHAIAHRLKAAGIEIPYAQREIRLRGAGVGIGGAAESCDEPTPSPRPRKPAPDIAVDEEPMREPDGYGGQFE